MLVLGWRKEMSGDKRQSKIRTAEWKDAWVRVWHAWSLEWNWRKMSFILNSHIYYTPLSMNDIFVRRVRQIQQSSREFWVGCRKFCPPFILDFRRKGGSETTSHSQISLSKGPILTRTHSWENWPFRPTMPFSWNEIIPRQQTLF
jgi:hypothetical protein